LAAYIPQKQENACHSTTEAGKCMPFNHRAGCMAATENSPKKNKDKMASFTNLIGAK
jgi:hypothetical protein